MRQVGPIGRSVMRKSGTEANSLASKPTDRRSRPTELLNSGSSSITKTVGSDSGITFPIRKDQKSAFAYFASVSVARFDHTLSQKQTASPLSDISQSLAAPHLLQWPYL